MGALIRGLQALSRRLRSAGSLLHDALPDMRDLHVYGGGAMVAWGAASVFPPAGWVAFGLVLLYLGLRRR
jgi:hypothetical protein